VSEMSEVTPEEPSEERRKEIRDEARGFARVKRANYAAISADAWKQRESARKYLMISGLVGLVVGQLNLVPRKIESLGISFDLSEQANFRYLIIAVIVMKLCARTINRGLQTRGV
jgi:hypothetical protein